MDFQTLFAPVGSQLQSVEDGLLEALNTEIPLLRESSRHLVEAGGKRLRPAFVLLSGGLFTDELDSLVPLAVALELVHLATLVHDDVIDNSLSRRGRETVKAKYGDEISIYSGDYILARALMKVSYYNRADLTEIVGRASVQVCEGEMVQLKTCFKVDQTLKDYLRRIERKTAILMALSTRLGPLVADAHPRMVRLSEKFGYYLGMSFQITDDILDFTADEKILGKPTGSDIRQGIITLPALFALRYSPERNELRKTLSSSVEVEKNAERALEIVKNSGGIDYSMRIAEEYVRRAQRMLGELPEGDLHNALSNIADLVYAREF